jgi:predicted nucleic acid-binding protein
VLLATLTERRQGVISTQVLGEFFNTVVRLRPQVERVTAEQAVDDFCEAFPVVALDVDIVRAAVAASGRHQMSYWDALIWATAKLNGISTVLTEDIQSSGAIEGVSFVDPFAPGFDLQSLR